MLRAVPDISPDPAGDVSARRDVLAALADLPERQREVLVLRYYGDLSEAEIAEALGVSRGAVKSYASREQPLSARSWRRCDDARRPARGRAA